MGGAGVRFSADAALWADPCARRTTARAHRGFTLRRLPEPGGRWNKEKRCPAYLPPLALIASPNALTARRSLHLYVSL